MSGSGTNIGIEYQNKVSAWFLLQMFLGTNIGQLLRGLEEMYAPTSVKFESNDPIDDLVVNSPQLVLYLQIKHSLSLSSEEGSEFLSTISQFIEAFHSQSGNRRFVLVTSTRASSVILFELTKIIESIRYNPSGWRDNPFTSKEQEVLSKFEQCVSKANSRFGPLTEEQFVSFTSLIRVVQFDIEASQSMEIATMLQIQGITNLSPLLVWDFLTTRSIEFAGSRQSVSKEAIEALLRPFSSQSIDARQLDSILPGWFKVVLKGEEGFSSGVDYIFGQIDMDGKPTLIVTELYRFTADGKMRLKYEDNVLDLENGIKIIVLYRCSSKSRMVSFLETSEAVKGKKLVVLQSNIDSSQENGTIYAKAWSDALAQSLPKTTANLLCLHCAEYISEFKFPLIDDASSRIPKIAYVHKACRKGADRVVGYTEFPIFEGKPWLKSFNVEKWIAAYTQSINSLDQATEIRGRTVTVLWDDKFEYPSGKYCYRYMLSDGSVEYVHKRVLVDRDGESTVETELKKLRAYLDGARSSGDPLCILSKSRKFGNYSYLISESKGDDEVLEIVSVDRDTFCLPIKRTYEVAQHYYAPVSFLRLVDKNQEFTFGSYFVLITNPFRLGTYLKNWTQAGLVIPEYSIEVVDTDPLFDNLMRNTFERGYSVIINPLMDMKGRIVSGVEVKKLSEVGSAR